MAFNNRKKKEQHRIVRFSDVEYIVIETDGMHFELLPQERIVQYRNVISPKDGWMSFPEGYFDTQVSSIPCDTMSLISIAFERLFTNIHLEERLDFLPTPTGGTRDVLMRFSLIGSTVNYTYTNEHVVNDGNGFMVKTDPVAEEFIQIVQLLKPFCTFPKFIPEEIQIEKSPQVLNKINANIEFDDITRLIGYRFDATGVFGYTYYTASDNVCSVSKIIAPSAPVTIHGNGVAWKSDFIDDSTIGPGLTRSVNDESSGAEIFWIVFQDSGEYEINESIMVYCDTRKYTFYCNDIVIAKILRYSGKFDYLQKSLDIDYCYEPYYEITAYNGIDTELFMLILAFPMLEFGF